MSFEIYLYLVGLSPVHVLQLVVPGKEGDALYRKAMYKVPDP